MVVQAESRVASVRQLNTGRSLQAGSTVPHMSYVGEGGSWTTDKAS